MTNDQIENAKLTIEELVDEIKGEARFCHQAGDTETCDKLVDIYNVLQTAESLLSKLKK